MYGSQRFATSTDQPDAPAKNLNTSRATRTHLNTYASWSRLRYPEDDDDSHVPYNLPLEALSERLAVFAKEVRKQAVLYFTSDGVDIVSTELSYHHCLYLSQDQALLMLLLGDLPVVCFLLGLCVLYNTAYL